MGFWDWLIPPPDEGGRLRKGKKHGRWVERDDHGSTELTYVDGVKHGPFVERHDDGTVRREGTYAGGELDGRSVYRHRGGGLGHDAMYRAGKLHGHLVQHHANGAFYYESDYEDDQRHGPWKSHHDNGQPHELGAHVHGERDGEWSVRSKEGVLIEQGRYARGKRVGPWQLRRADGSICAEGAYEDGRMHGAWRSVSTAGVAGTPRVCADEAELQRWAELEACAALIAAYGAEDAWIAQAKGVLEGLAQPWQVSATKDSFGQTHLSAPLGASWQLRVALGVPLHVVCRDECWSRIVRLIDELPGREDAVALVERSGRRYPTYAPRDWLTLCLEEEADDPRCRLVSRFEPGRQFTAEAMARFRRRVPHLEELSLRECSFAEGFAPLFETGYPALERLFVVRSETRDGAIAELIGLLARARWAGNLVQLAIIESGGGVADDELAALLANPHLTSLKFLTFDGSALGPACARALATAPLRDTLEAFDLRDSTLDLAALAALAACPALEKLTLKRCQLPDMTTRQAQTLVSPRLREVSLHESLGVERWGSGNARTGYAVMRRLAQVPALEGVEVLDLSYNELDGLAARALARSPYLGKLRSLAWAGNETDEDELAELRAALPASAVDRDGKPGNVVVLQL